MIFFIVHPNSLNQNPVANKGDSLFELSQLEIVGLVIISSTMAVVLYAINFIKTEKLYKYFSPKITHNINYVWIFLVDALLTVFLCLFLIALAPQIHYTYYQQIMSNLPNQIVFAAGLSADKLIDLLVLPVGSSIADYSTGFVLWLCFITIALYAVFRKKLK